MSASPAGSAQFRKRHRLLPEDHFRNFQGLRISSIGMGTYLGDSNDATDALYAEAIPAALKLGCNVFDTAINYRCQRSERTLGRTLNRLIQHEEIGREEVLLCTKGGYFYFDNEVPADFGRHVVDNVITPRLADYEDIVGGCHCIATRYLNHSLQASRRNLGLETIDIYYLHNPEQQLDAVDRSVFLKRMEDAFAFLEACAANKQIQYYGIATWNGLRVGPTQPNYLSLEALAEAAKQIGGEDHHFRAVQLPYNLAMPEAYSFANQTVAGETVTVLEAARRLGISVISSAGLLQGRLSTLPASLAERIPGLNSAAQRALQFARSTPGITTALVGMKQRAHVEENLSVAAKPALDEAAIKSIFNRTEKR